jgi:deoxycytidylate deaminase
MQSKLNESETSHNYSKKYTNTICILKKLAINSNLQQKHAAALIRKKSIISIGMNIFSNKINIVVNKEKQIYYKTVHAEMNIFKKLQKKSYKGFDIFVIRIDKHANLKNSRPCSCCIEKLDKIGIRKVYYSNENGDIVSEFVKNMEKTHSSSGTKFFNDLKALH